MLQMGKIKQTKTSEMRVEIAGLLAEGGGGSCFAADNGGAVE